MTLNGWERLKMVLRKKMEKRFISKKEMLNFPKYFHMSSSNFEIVSKSVKEKKV